MEQIYGFFKGAVRYRGLRGPYGHDFMGNSHAKLAAELLFIPFIYSNLRPKRGFGLGFRG